MTKSSASLRIIDDFDRAILAILQRDNKRPQREIAEAVHLSTAAVQRRIAAMEKAGIIAHNVAIIDPAALGLDISAMVEVTLNNEWESTVAKARAIFEAAPEVQQIYYVTGGVSFVLMIVAPDLPTYESLTKKLFTHNDAVASFRSLIALERIKATMRVPIG